MKYKAFFIILEGFSAARSCPRRKSGPLKVERDLLRKLLDPCLGTQLMISVSRKVKPGD